MQEPIGSAVSSPKPSDVAAALARIEAQRRRTIDALTDGVLSKKDAKEALARYEAQAADLRRRHEREQTKAAAEERAADPSARAAVLQMADAMRKAWKKLTVEERQAVISTLAERVEVGRAGPRFTWRSIADLTAKKSSIT